MTKEHASGVPLRGRVWPWTAAIAVAAATTVMILKINSVGLGGDEGFTAQMVKLPWRTMLADLTHIDYNMSAHYGLLKMWTSVFGFSEVALRLPSVIAVVVALPLLYHLVATTSGQRLAALAVIFAGLNPFVLMVGLTARPYAFLLLWSVVATLRLNVAIESQTRASWIWYGGVAVVGLHIHLMAALVIVAHATFALIRQRGLRQRHLEAAGVIILFGVVPTALFLAPANTLAWIGPFSLQRAATTGMAVAGGGLFGALMLGLALVGTLRPPQNERRMSLLATSWLGVPTLLCLALAPFQSLFVPIYFVVITAPLAVLSALGVNRLLATRTTWTIPAGLALGSFGLILALTLSQVVRSPGWRELPSLLSQKVLPGDVIAFPNAYYRIVAEYYASESQAGPFPPALPTLPLANWGSLRPLQLNTLERTGGQTDHEVFEAQTVGEPRVWLVGYEDSFKRTVAEDLVEHGYRLAEVVESHQVGASLYVIG